VPHHAEVPDEDPEAAVEIEGETVREVVREPEPEPEPADPDSPGTTSPAPVEPAGPPTTWNPIAMPASVDRQVRSLLGKVRSANFRVVRWMVFDHTDGRGTAYVVYELTRHDACNALARATRTSKTPSEARARFEDECTSRTDVPLQQCKYVGLARFAISSMPAPGVAGSPARLELARDEVLDPELCSLSFVEFALRDVDGDPGPELLLDFEWQDLVGGNDVAPAPTKRVHAILVFRPDLALQESRSIGTEYFEPGSDGAGAPRRGSWRLEDVNRDGHADLVLEKETVEHCAGCRSTRERIVLRYDAARDEWR